MDDLIVFGEDFGSLPSSTQHLIKNLSQNRKVLWVNSIGLRKPKLCLQDLTRAINKIFSTPKPQYINSADSIANIHIANLKTLPAPKYKWERRLAKSLMLKQLKPILASLDLQNPILWLSLPTAVDLCGELGESAVVYYCGDDFSALAGVDHHTVVLHEQLLTKRADIILVASQNMLTKFPQAKTHLIAHAVDHAFFTPVPSAVDLPKGKPILGFYGSLAEWLDDELIYQVASQKPDWNLVFIGPQIKAFPKLEKLSNLFFLGSRAHHLLPSYSQHWQMSWLPFKNNAQIKGCSPLKLMEYIAAGKPIATTEFDALKEFRQTLNIIRNSQEMIELLNNPSSWVMPKSKMLIKENWQARAAEVEKLFAQI